MRYIILIGLICISSCTGDGLNNTEVTGWLQGNIDIGPLCPVETIPPDPNCLPTVAIYLAYPVSVYTKAKKNTGNHIGTRPGRRFCARINGG